MTRRRGNSFSHISFAIRGRIDPNCQEHSLALFRPHSGVGRRMFPKLAGLSKAYIQSSLKAYRSGARSSGFMQPFAQDLSDADIENFASYFGDRARQSNRSAAIDKPLVEKGARLAEPGKNVRGGLACRACPYAAKSKAVCRYPRHCGAVGLVHRKSIEAVPRPHKVGNSQRRYHGANSRASQ